MTIYSLAGSYCIPQIYTTWKILFKLQHIKCELYIMSEWKQKGSENNKNKIGKIHITTLRRVRVKIVAVKQQYVLQF